jgi:hypothetical protein
MAYGYAVAFIVLLGAVVNHVLEVRDPPGEHRDDGAPDAGVPTQQAGIPL